MTTKPQQQGSKLQGFEQATKDRQTVTREGDIVQEQIHGVLVRHAVTHADERGTLTEIFDERWEFTVDSVPYVYTATIRPGQVRGWVVHLEQDDRLSFVKGTAKLVLYDAREDSETFGLANVFFLGDHDRALVRIPAGVVHAVKNVGADEVVFVNLPTQPYDHADPDKYRFLVDGAIPVQL
jgi:dTDP-4-dehydrorhamnose 3,5-epimerase